MQYACIGKAEWMPKQVDQHARRTRIAEAVFRLAASQGLEAVSLRHVAAEAGVSMGQVQHYFSTKDELLLFAFRVVSERAEQRFAAAAGAVPEGAGPGALVRALLGELLGDVSLAEAPVTVAFLARAVVHPDLAATIRAGAPAMVDFLAREIRTAQAAGSAPAGLDPVREAATLIALVDGLTTQLLIGQLDQTTAVATLDYQLDRIFAGLRGAW
jgi:TetR/AcrR family transcriptional repressor of bet genes